VTSAHAAPVAECQQRLPVQCRAVPAVDARGPVTGCAQPGDRPRASSGHESPRTSRQLRRTADGYQGPEQLFL